MLIAALRGHHNPVGRADSIPARNGPKKLAQLSWFLSLRPPGLRGCANLRMRIAALRQSPPSRAGFKMQICTLIPATRYMRVAEAFKSDTLSNFTGLTIDATALYALAGAMRL